MPRLKATYQQVLDILLAHGFELLRHDGGSHRRYRWQDPEDESVVQYVDLAPHQWSDDVPTGTLKSIIRQSGLPKALFRR